MNGPENAERAAEDQGREDNARKPGTTAAPDREPEQPARTGGPEHFRLGGEPPRVMRLSRKALAAMGLVAGVGIGGALLYALQPGHNAPPQNLVDTGHAAKSDVVTSAPGTYDKVPKLGSPLPGDLGRPILAAQQNGSQVPVPPMGRSADNPRMVAAEQARERVQQERTSALASKLFLGGGSAAQTGQLSNGTGGATALASAGHADVAAPVGAQAKDAGSGQASKRAFLQVAGTRTTVSSERITEPVSPNIIQAGSVIPAALITGIRSDLPGQITAQVTQNVYDSPTSRILLLPQGSRLIGEYDSQVSAGQTRVLLAWDRLILPGGRSILLDRQPGADAAGFAGLQDKVNYHWGNMLRAAAISTLLGVGTQLATNDTDPLVQALRYGTQDTINQTGKQLVERELAVAPTLTIRPGYPLRVIITRDLVFESQGEGR